MKLSRGFAAMLVFAPAAANAATDDPALERTVQAALESLNSGVAMTARGQDGRTAIFVRPLRTWKSITGHYCRNYELRVERAGELPVIERTTRCRDGGGIWKKVEEG